MLVDEEILPKKCFDCPEKRYTCKELYFLLLKIILKLINIILIILKLFKYLNLIQQNFIFRVVIFVKLQVISE